MIYQLRSLGFALHRNETITLRLSWLVRNLILRSAGWEADAGILLQLPIGSSFRSIGKEDCFLLEIGASAAHISQPWNSLIQYCSNALQRYDAKPVFIFHTYYQEGHSHTNITRTIHRGQWTCILH